MLVTDIKDVTKIFQRTGYKQFFQELIKTLEEDFKSWDEFVKVPRVASHSSLGVIELMPINNSQLYSFKYVNGHPKNPNINKSTVMATGQLSLTETGEPIFISEMTILTAFRTAATSAMAGKYLASKDSSTLAIIGTGAQSEFQALAFGTLFDLKEIRYFDIDTHAMEKFEKNMAQYSYKLTRCSHTQEAILGADIITTETADKKNQTILTKEMVQSGVFINAIGGDCPGKTELEASLVESCKVIVEYLPQTIVEGEIQQTSPDIVYGELHEIISGKKEGRNNNEEIILFDSVGFAIEDFSVLRFVYQLAKDLNIGKELDLIPSGDPKDLFSLLDKKD